MSIDKRHRERIDTWLKKSDAEFVRAEAARQSMSMSNLLRQVVETARNEWIAWQKARRG